MKKVKDLKKGDKFWYGSVLYKVSEKHDGRYLSAKRILDECGGTITLPDEEEFVSVKGL